MSSLVAVRNASADTHRWSARVDVSNARVCTQVREGHVSIVKQLVGHGVMIRNDTIGAANMKSRFSNNPDRQKIKDYLNFVAKVDVWPGEGWSLCNTRAWYVLRWTLLVECTIECTTEQRVTPRVAYKVE